MVKLGEIQLFWIPTGGRSPTSTTAKSGSRGRSELEYHVPHGGGEVGTGDGSIDIIDLEHVFPWKNDADSEIVDFLAGFGKSTAWNFVFFSKMFRAIFCWLVVWNIFYVSIYWEYYSHLTFIFFRGVGQPPTSLVHFYKTKRPILSFWNISMREMIWISATRMGKPTFFIGNI